MEKDTEKDTRKGSGRRCVAMFCDNTSKEGKSLFSWPKEPRLRRLWTRFVRRRRADFQEPSNDNKSCALCEDHFRNEDFEDDMKWRMGFRKSRRLQPEAVPSLLSVQLPQRTMAMPSVSESDSVDCIQVFNMFKAA